MEPYIGQMLDNRYELLERIGAGGMAVVYKAKCHRLNRLVAVKILKSDLAQDEEFRRRFSKESQAVAQLSHANIVSVYDVSRDGDLDYIVMELVDGITLKQYMESRGELNWREALHFIIQIMRGLKHAHSRGIIHRDIKPQNIMVLRDGSVKVTDFGIACLENAAQTLTQEALGSVHYISPEQARGERTDARSDIYSAGVVLYEMLTNRLPFDGDSAVAVALQHLRSIPLAPREIKPDLPEALELICLKAMAPNLNQRYASAEAMIQDLEAFRKNPEIDLDFSIEDVLPVETDEPTRPLQTSSVQRSEPRTHSRRREEDWFEDEDEDEDDRSGRAHVINSVLIGGIAILSVLIVFFLARNVFSSFLTGEPATEEYEVPYVIGYTVDEIESWETIDGIFDIQIDGYEPSDTYLEDQIMEQDPQSGVMKKGANLVIHVTLSSGEDTGEMPDIVNKERRQALLALQSLQTEYDLNIVEEEEYSDKYNTDYVIDTNPVAGSTLTKGQTVTIIISQGPQPKTAVVVPFVGMQIENVKSQLSVMGLIPNITEVENSAPAGQVIYQSIPANTEVEQGTIIDLTVSTGPAEEEEEEPTTPTEPSTPEEPTTPTEPSTPEEPSAPTTPTTPTTPTEPTTPTTPTEPSTPEEPTTPTEPDTPDEPDEPDTTVEPEVGEGLGIL